MSTYRHTQVGWRMFAGSAVGIALVTVLVLALSPTTRAAAPWLIVALYGLLVVGCLLFPTLTVTVDEDAIRLVFGIGIIRTTVPVADLVGAERVRVRLRWGWGVHWTPSGWLYNIGGREAVKVAVRRDRGVIIASDDADRLYAAIVARIALRGK